MENIYVYCVSEANLPRTVFKLGPFFDGDEAENVESQAHSLLSQYQVQRGRYRVNPLELSEFWEWIDAQILPICVYEETAFPCQPSRLGRMDCRPTFSLRRSSDVEGRASDSLEEVRS